MIEELRYGECCIQRPASPTCGRIHGVTDSEGAQPERQAATSTDSIQLSKTAQAMLAALQEARETPFQTAKEASHGDLQARRLLANEAAAKSIAK